jgi:hypothetical protein
VNRLAPLALVLFGAACGQSPDVRPPPMRGKTPGVVYSCAELVDAGVTAVGLGLGVGDKPAGCLTDGLACPLTRLGLDIGACDGGEAEAECMQNQWRVACVTSDAGNGPGDGGPDRPPDGTND